MYARVSLEPDAARAAHRYVEQVQQRPMSVRVTELGQRLRKVNPWVLDALIATLLVGASLVGIFSSGDSSIDYKDPDAFALALTLGAVVPYYFRRRSPLLVLLISIVCVVVLATNDYAVGATPTALLIGMYTVSAWGTPRERATGAAAMALGLAVVAVLGTPDLDGAGMAFNVVFYTAAFFWGSTVRNRRLYTAQLEERAADLERERDEEAKRAVAEERLRIAQELHDVVAHSMGVIAVQAGVGAHVIDRDPAEAKKSLEAISSTSRSTLTEMRRLLGVLREDDGAAYAPAPGIADLERLARDIEASGVEVEVAYDGERSELPPGVDFTAYRIVQEALTNVLKHAGPAHATVTIGFEPSVLRVAVVDDGRGVNGRSDGGGHGLMGMRERVGVYGGTFVAGPRAGGGFGVEARIPYGVDS